jgi:hypothetical protein
MSATVVRTTSAARYTTSTATTQVELTNVRQCSGRADYTHVKLYLRNGHFLESAFLRESFNPCR